MCCVQRRHPGGRLSHPTIWSRGPCKLYYPTAAAVSSTRPRSPVLMTAVTYPQTPLIANNGEPVRVPDVGGRSNFLQELLERLFMGGDMRVRTTEPHLEM